MKQCSRKRGGNKPVPAERGKRSERDPGAQLAAVATMPEPSVEAMKAIEGVGDGRVEKYGEALLSVLLSVEDTLNETEPKRTEVVESTSEVHKKIRLSSQCYTCKEPCFNKGK